MSSMHTLTEDQFREINAWSGHCNCGASRNRRRTNEDTAVEIFVAEIYAIAKHCVCPGRPTSTGSTLTMFNDHGGHDEVNVVGLDDVKAEELGMMLLQMEEGEYETSTLDGKRLAALEDCVRGVAVIGKPWERPRKSYIYCDLGTVLVWRDTMVMMTGPGEWTEVKPQTDERVATMRRDTQRRADEAEQALNVEVVQFLDQVQSVGRAEKEFTGPSFVSDWAYVDFRRRVKGLARERKFSVTTTQSTDDVLVVTPGKTKS